MMHLDQIVTLIECNAGMYKHSEMYMYCCAQTLLDVFLIMIATGELSSKGIVYTKYKIE